MIQGVDFSLTFELHHQFFLIKKAEFCLIFRFNCSYQMSPSVQFIFIVIVVVLLVECYNYASDTIIWSTFNSNYNSNDDDIKRIHTHYYVIDVYN